MPNTEHEDYEFVTCQHCGQPFKAITVRHLRNIHGYTGEHPIREYKQRFGLTSASSPDVRGRLSEHKIEFWDVRKQHWTPEKILGAIRRRYQEGQSLQAKQVPNSLMLAASRRFGSWGVALQMAGLDYDAITSHRRWDREKVIAEIRKLEADQVPLNGSWIMRHHGDLHRAALKLFPSSWNKALQAAGFDPLEHKKRKGRWTKKKAEAWVRQRIDKSRSLLAGDAPRDLHDFVRSALKSSWTDYIESFGVPYPGIKKRRDWSKDLVLSEIQRWAAEGHRTNRKSLAREYQALLQQGLKYFGSWDAARLAAGVAVEHGRSGPPPSKVNAPASAPPAQASVATGSQRPIANLPARLAPRPADALAAPAITQDAARDSTTRPRAAAPSPRMCQAGHEPATGHALRRAESAATPPAARDPILAFLARGGVDETIEQVEQKVTAKVAPVNRHPR